MWGYNTAGVVLWPDGVSAVLELGAAVALPFRESKVGFSDLRLHYHTGVSRRGAAQPWDPRGGRWLPSKFPSVTGRVVVGMCCALVLFG